MSKRTGKRSRECQLTVTVKAAEQLRIIQQGNTADPSHVMRMEAESEGFSLWLGPEVAGDAVLGTKETYQLRVSPDQAEHMAGENLTIDFWEDSPRGPCLIIYREEEPPPHLRTPRIRRTRTASRGSKKSTGRPPAGGRNKEDGSAAGSGPRRTTNRRKPAHTSSRTGSRPDRRPGK